MTSRSCPTNKGFSLTEVALAVAIIAIAIPAVLGMLGVFSNSSRLIIDQGEAAAAVNSFQLYLDGDLTDAATNDEATFEDVYGWVYNDRTTPGTPEVVYAYKDANNPGTYLVSTTEPTGLTEDKILAAEIIAPEESLLPNAMLVADVANFTKAYLPLKLSIYAVSVGSQQRTAAELVGTYPLVVLR